MLNKPTSQNIKSNKGFVLIITLSMIAIMFIAVSFFSRWINQEVLYKNNQAETPQQIVDKFSTLSTLIYLSNTRPTTFSGISFPERNNNSYTLPIDSEENVVRKPLGNELRLDNRLYQGIGESKFRLQDDYGLLSINEITQVQLSRLLKISGNSASASKNLHAILRDYIDRDSSLRQNGAENQQYLKRGLTAPANHPLRTPEELMKVLDWQKHFNIAGFHTVKGYLTAVPNTAINLNTASRTTLLLAGISAQSADKLISFRQTQAITINDVSKLLLANEVINDGDNYLYYPSRDLRISLSSGRSQTMEQYFLKFTPLSESGQPWKIRYSKKINFHQKGSESVFSTGQNLFGK